MKFTCAIVLFVIVGCVRVSDAASDAMKCDNGPSYWDGCNYCMCIPKAGYACTRMNCINNGSSVSPEDAAKCDNGPNYWDGCNYCMCIPMAGYACTRMNCIDNSTPPSSESMDADLM